MRNAKQIYAKARSMDLVDYLSSLGFEAKQIRRNDYWYLSPFREEKEPSFKINRKLNVWYDHGIGKGGNLIEFGKVFYKCDVKDFLNRLDVASEVNFSFQNLSENRNFSPEAVPERRIMITDCRPIADPVLRQYLHERNIPLIIANRFCSEIEFELYRKKQLAIGFKNRLGGYELRSENFKGSSSPKSITVLKNNPSTISVFEGCFDFLSFQTALLFDRKLIHELSKNQDSYLILNSLSFLDTSREIMEKYQQIDLYLDHDESGLKTTIKALEWSEKYKDKSHIYDAFKDLNDYHIEHRKDELKQSRFYRHKSSSK